MNTMANNTGKSILICGVGGQGVVTIIENLKR